MKIVKNIHTNTLYTNPARHGVMNGVNADG